MSSLADFIAIGKECGFVGDKLLEFAENKLAEAKEAQEKAERKAKEAEKKAEERAAAKAKEAFDKELRL